LGSRFLFGHGRYLFACALCHFLVMLYSQPSFLFMEILVEKSLFIQAHFTYCVVFYSLYLLAKSHFGVHKCQVFHSARLYLSPKIPSSMALISNRQSFFQTQDIKSITKDSRSAMCLEWKRLRAKLPVPIGRSFVLKKTNKRQWWSPHPWCTTILGILNPWNNHWVRPPHLIPILVSSSPQLRLRRLCECCVVCRSTFFNIKKKNKNSGFFLGSDASKTTTERRTRCRIRWHPLLAHYRPQTLTLLRYILGFGYHSSILFFRQWCIDLHQHLMVWEGFVSIFVIDMAVLLSFLPI